MGYDGSNKTYRQLKTIKVRRQDGSFDYYMVPEFAVKGAYVDKPKPVVEPIVDLATQNNQQAVIQPQPVSKSTPPKSNVVANQTPPKPATTESNTIVKQPVPQDLLPYIANVSSDGVAFFNIPDGYTAGQFEQAVEAVYGQNKDLSQKPMVYYEQPQQQIQQQKQQQQASQQSQAQKQQATQGQNMKYNTSNNTKVVKVPVKGVDEPDLVTEVFAYPRRRVNTYNIHPEAYQKVLEYLNKNFNKTKPNNKPDWYVLSLYGFDKVPIGGEVYDSVFHYIGKEGKDAQEFRYYDNNPNVINENEPISHNVVLNDIILDNGKLKMYSYSNNDSIYYKTSNGVLTWQPLNWNTSNKVGDASYHKDSEFISNLRGHGLTEQQIADYINKGKNVFTNIKRYNVDRSIFRPIEKEQQTQNNSGQQTKNTNNLVQKAKQAGKKVLSFLGFQNGGQLKYYKNGK